MVLHLRHLWWHNAFQTFAAVKLRPGGHGTEVSVTLRSSYFVAAFITFWLGLVILFNFGMFGRALTTAGQFQDLAFTIGFPLFGFAFLAFGRLIARSEGDALLDFIQQTTDARELSPEFRPPR
jgi:hypothetical protein